MTIPERSPSRPVACTSIVAWTATSPSSAGRKGHLFTPSSKTASGRCFYANSLDEAGTLLRDLVAQRARFKGTGRVDTLRGLERNFDIYTAHHLMPGLPADNNVTENVIKQLNKKLRLMEGFESIQSAERYVRLLVGCYRFKRFTDSCRGNGKSPLELAGIDLQGRDWLSFLLQR